MTPREEWRLPTQHIGQHTLVFDQLDSTNTCATQLAEKGNNGLVILADQQSDGRGQHGRTWQAPPQAAVLMSVLLFPPPELRRPAVLTAWVAVSVAELVRQTTGQEARIKWPNDVLIQGRKVCGILIEQGRGTVVGIGLNVRQTPEDFERQGLPEATSLTQWAAAPLYPYTVATLLIQQLDEEYARLLQGDLMTLETRWKLGIGLVGQLVAAVGPQQTVCGRLLDLTFAGVVIQMPGGEVVRLAPEAVRQLKGVE